MFWISLQYLDIRKLKEMIVFPLLYPEVFTNLGISPPRGVIFQGPPGTGKTLLARLLAENCSVPGGSGRKVSFFMKNGSDCLSKWVGEAERNLRDLFNKARQQQPSIIFFDEIDGLAPERNGRQDQSHNSLVATLLALMDGLDDRGNVVVIGATNRVNSIDPALRRPGRFDREFTFELPNKDTRRDILKIHTATWKPHPSDCLLEKLSQETTDFSGADLKALCVEASLRAMRRACPRAYDLHLPPPDPTEISSCLTFLEVTEKDFEDAFCDIIPSICRGKRTTRPLTGPLELLLNPVVDNISSNIRLASLAQTGNGDSWMDGKSISFIESVQVYHFADKWTIHTSFLPRIVAALSKCLLQMRVVALYALDLIGRPRDLLLTHLHGLLPSSGGVLIMCDLGSLFENDLYDDLRSILVHFIRDSFYPGGAHLLVLLNSQSWDCDTLVTDAIEEHVSKFELDPPQLSFKEYCSEWARRLVLSEVIVKPLINWSSTASAIDVAKIESLMLQIGKELANLYENDPTRTTIVKDLIRRYIDGEETNDDLSDTIGTGL